MLPANRLSRPDAPRRAKPALLTSTGDTSTGLLVIQPALDPKHATMPRSWSSLCSASSRLRNVTPNRVSLRVGLDTRARSRNSGEQVDIGASISQPAEPGDRVGTARRQPGPRSPRPHRPPSAARAPDCGGYIVVMPPDVTPADLASFRPAPPSLTGEPTGFGVVGTPTNVVAAASEQTLPGTLLGWDVTVRFTPAGYVFDYGDGATARVTTGGSSWAALGQAQFTPTATSHVYRERGTYPVIVTRAVRGIRRFRHAARGDPSPDSSTATTGGYDVRVVEARTALVDQTCAGGPARSGLLSAASRTPWQDERVTDRLMLLDTASLYFRAFYGVPDTVRAPDGTPVNAVRGFLDIIARLVTTYRADAPRRVLGRRLAAAVARRPHPDLQDPPGRRGRRRRARRRGGARPARGAGADHPRGARRPRHPIVGAAEHEADDVIGTLATRATMPVDIVTGDRDLFQLVDDARDVRVIYTARGMSNLEIVTDATVVAKYGVLPAPVRRLRHPARRLLGRPARRRRRRREDRGGAAGDARRPRRHHRRRRSRRGHVGRRAQRRSSPACPTSPSPRPSSPSCATSTSPTCRLAAAPAREPREGGCRGPGRRWALGAAMTRILDALDASAARRLE